VIGYGRFKVPRDVEEARHAANEEERRRDGAGRLTPTAEVTLEALRLSGRPLTTLQLARRASALADGGRALELRLVRGLARRAGTIGVTAPPWPPCSSPARGTGRPWA
jgi:hypothetical protein